MKIKTMRHMEEEKEEEQPLSPAARLFHSPKFNCYIISLLGCKIKIDTDVIIQGLKQTLIRHPRFSSKLVMDGNKRRKQTWVRTEVNIEDHVVVPNIEQHNIENADEFIENYVSNLTLVPLDVSRPLWELHILDVRTLEAENVVVLKIHHSVGDGMSLMSLILACTRKTSNPEEIPSLPVKNRSKSQFTSSRNKSRFWWLVLTMWSAMLYVFNTFCDVLEFVGTTLFLKDTETPIKGKGKREGLTDSRPRRLVHRTVSLDDIKLIKNAMKMTVNDVVFGVTQAGLSRYLNRKYGDDMEKNEANVLSSDNLPERIRLRAAILVNIRPNTGIQALADMISKGSKCRWGNWIGYIVVPFFISVHSDPLEHLRRAKATIDRKKHSFEAFLTFTAGKFILETFGVQVAANIISRAVSNTTVSFSNLMGPVEEISFYGHPITYLAPSVYGHPHALTMHFQSYMNKMKISLTVDPTIISDPHGLCDDLEESLLRIKSSVQEKGLV